MLKTTKLFAAAAIALACIAPHAFALGTSEAYYIAFDEFTMNNQESSGITKSSPYDAFDIGGNVSRGNITDMSEYAPVEAKREFNRADGKFVWELSVDTKSAPDGGIIALRSGDTNVIVLENESGKLYLNETKNKKTALNADGTFYGIKAYVDADTGKYDLQVNGESAARGAEFLNKADYVDNFYVRSNDNSTGAFVLDAMRIHKNYILNEWFMSSHSAVPDDWKQIGSGISLQRLASSIQNDYYSLLINDSDFTKECGVSHSIDAQSGEIQLEFQFLAPKKVKKFGAYIRSGGKDIIGIGFENLNFGYETDGKFTSCYKMRENLWYHAMIKLKSDGAQIYINHKLIADRVPYENGIADEVRFLTGRVATGEVYIDDIMAKPIEKLPEDYVPTPVKPEKKDDTIVSVQSCNIWREGTHFGWDSIAPYPERETYLGFYDEGSTEVRDWETKWMVEHGIDAEIYCWYRQPTSKSDPIKRPRNSFELHDAYFNSEYSKMIKFAIAWENGGAQTTGFDDFAENIVPYWIEQYFKDERYLVIDNKPVIVFYTYNNLVRDFGSVQGAKRALSYLREECRKIGFDGAYLLTTTGSSDKRLLQNIKDVGFDGIYCYSWDVNCSDINVQKQGMLKQLETDTVSVLATVGMGRDDTPWERTPGGFVSESDYEELLKWVRDTYIPSLPSGSIGSKLMTLDNWNEYGEGHYIAPSPLTEFKYLDAVRNVFANAAEHDDAIPTENAKKRFNHLYVQDRKVEKSFRAKEIEKKKAQADPLEGFTVIKAFDFDDDAGNYEIAKQIENFKTENGVLSGDATDSDPGFYLKNINIPTNAIKGIKIRFKTDTPSAKMQFYFITEQIPTYSEGKSMFETVDQNGDFVTAVLQPSGADGWSGTLTDFRVDPMASKGHFEIDSIEIVGLDLSKAQSLNINSQPQYPQRNIIIENGVMYVPAAEYAIEFGYRWCNSLDGKYLCLLNSDTGDGLSLEYGKDALMSNGESFMALRKVAESASCSVLWDSETNSVNVITPQKNTSSSDEPDPIGEVNFNRDGITSGVTAFGNMSNIRVSGGALNATAGTSDPNMRLTFSLNAEDYPYCNIRIKNRSLGNTFKVYFTTETDRSFSESKACEARLSQNDKDFKEYTINMTSNTLWQGKIVDIRIDATDGVGDFAIDYIRFSKNPGGSASEEASDKNIIFGGSMDKKELKYTTENLSAEYSLGSGYLGKYGLKLTPKGSGYIKIPADIVKNNKYTLSFAAKSCGAGKIAVGTYIGGELSEIASLDISGNWQKLSAAFSKESGADGIYIMPVSGGAVIDSLRLGETEAQIKDEKPQRTDKKTGPLRVLIIGNSITQHNKSESIGWLGDWGMAATSADKDYVHLLERSIKAKDKNAVVKAANISEFEKYFYDFSLFNKSSYDYLAEFDADIIVCAYGANIKNPTNENDPEFNTKNQFTSEHYKKICDFFNVYSDASVIAAITPLTSYEVRENIKKSAVENNYTLVDLSDLTGDEYTAVNYSSADVFAPNVTDGVLKHPGDKAMEEFAKRIFSELSKAMDNIKR